MVADGEIVFAGGSGVADIAAGRPMTADTPLYIGSLSKVLTAALILQLVADGRLALDDRAVAGRNMTVGHLLTHASGLPMEAGFDYWFSGKFPDARALRDRLESLEPRFEPGSRSAYSNVGFAALGLVAGDATDVAYADLLRERVLTPAGMRHSGARGPAPGVAMAYSPPGTLLPSTARPFAGVGRQVGERHERVYHDAAAMSPAFGAWSTATDMGRFVAWLLAAPAAAPIRDGLFTVRRGRRSYGMRIEAFDGHRVARHGGWFAGYRSQLLIDPARGIGVVALTNSDDADPQAIVERLYRRFSLSRFR